MIVTFNTYTDTDTVQSFLYQTALGVPIPFGTGDSLHMQLRTNAADPTVYLDLSTINGLIVITNFSLGAFTLTMPVSQLLNMPPGIYQHSLVWYSPITATRIEIWRGTVIHAAGPTHWNLGTL